MIERRFSREGRRPVLLRGWWDAIWSVLNADPLAQARNDVKYFREMAALILPHLGNDLRGKLVLDVGCGHRYPYALLFASSGAVAVGIDLELVIRGQNPWKVSQNFPHNGCLVTGRTIAHLCLGKYRQYYRELEGACGVKLSHTNLQIKRMDITRMNFPDVVFDAVVSVGVFEHVRDITVGTREICRVLKPGGIACMYIHCFPALSGGHHPDWGEPSVSRERKVPPWDHLRGNRHPVPCYLNKEREVAYVRAFRELFEVLEVCDVDPEEGRPFLTPEIRRELAAYGETELVKRGIRILARKNC